MGGKFLERINLAIRTNRQPAAGSVCQQADDMATMSPMAKPSFRLKYGKKRNANEINIFFCVIWFSVGFSDWYSHEGMGEYKKG